MSYNWAQDGSTLLLDWTPTGSEKINLKVTRRVPLDDDQTAPLFFGEDILCGLLSRVMERCANSISMGRWLPLRIATPNCLP